MVPRIGHESHDRNSRLFERFVLSHSMAVTFVVYCKTQLLFRDLIGHSIIQADNYLLMRKQDRESTPDPTYSRARFSLTNNYCRVKNVFLRAFDIMFVDKLFVQVSRSRGVVSL